METSDQGLNAPFKDHCSGGGADKKKPKLITLKTIRGDDIISWFALHLVSRVWWGPDAWHYYCCVPSCSGWWCQVRPCSELTYGSNQNSRPAWHSADTADMLAMFHSVSNIQACRVANTVWQIGDIGIKNKKCAFSLQITILYLGI